MAPPAAFEAPKFEAPVFEAPKFEAPKFEAPKFEAPKFDAPKIDSPKFETPKFDAPKFEAPKFDAPKFEAPKFDAPKFDAPKFEAPKFDAPKFDAPAVPKFEAPKTDYNFETFSSPAAVQEDVEPQEIRDARAREAKQTFKTADNEAKVSYCIICLCSCKPSLSLIVRLLLYRHSKRKPENYETSRTVKRRMHKPPKTMPARLVGVVRSCVCAHLEQDIRKSTHLWVHKVVSCRTVLPVSTKVQLLFLE